MNCFLFISYLLSGDIQAVIYWLSGVGLMAFFIIIASLVDLKYGISASKRVGIFKTTSWGLRQTWDKDKGYMAFYFFSVLIDSCLSFLVPFPIACVLIAVGVIGTEALSVYEKKKIDGNMTSDPFIIAKTLMKTYGIADADKLEKVIEIIKEQQKIKNDVPAESPK